MSREFSAWDTLGEPLPEGLTGWDLAFYLADVRDNTPLGLGSEDTTHQDSTGFLNELKKLKFKKPTIRNFLINPPSSYAPTSPIPEEILKDTNLLWYHLHKKDTTDGQQ